ncbi:hypothetical protein EI94DRAFT_1785691 [Lactarius quietus]|nr:hypothetical protein EI94DRAFT_1785691 [Lactarius quietus]
MTVWQAAASMEVVTVRTAWVMSKNMAIRCGRLRQDVAEADELKLSGRLERFESRKSPFACILSWDPPDIPPKIVRSYDRVRGYSNLLPPKSWPKYQDVLVLVLVTPLREAVAHDVGNVIPINDTSSNASLPHAMDTLRGPERTSLSWRGRGGD